MSLTDTGNIVLDSDRAIPHRCPVCAKEPGAYTGKLVFPGEEAPMCENHKKALKQGRLTEAQVTMVPVEIRPAREMDLRLACDRLGGYVPGIAEGWCPGHAAA